MSELKVGDRVRLRSGSPVMTVTGADVAGERFECTWFEGQKRRADSFPSAALELAPAPASAPRITYVSTRKGF
jgi:uncharacterized protein YodC (DUF2158 family)